MVYRDLHAVVTIFILHCSIFDWVEKCKILSVLIVGMSPLNNMGLITTGADAVLFRQAKMQTCEWALKLASHNKCI